LRSDTRGGSRLARWSSSGCGRNKNATALRSATPARTPYCQKRSPVATWRSGTSAPETANATVFAPSHGPARVPWTRRVIIWHPVSSVEVQRPSANHAACIVQSASIAGRHARTTISASKIAARIEFPRRPTRKSRADATVPVTAPTPRARNTVPALVAVVPASAASAESVDPSATSTIPHTPIAFA